MNFNDFEIASRSDWNAGRWHVRAEWFGNIVPVFDPDNGDDLSDIADCIAYVKKMVDEPA